jgi:hypothetical protein
MGSKIRQEQNLGQARSFAKAAKFEPVPILQSVLITGDIRDALQERDRDPQREVRRSNGKKSGRLFHPGMVVCRPTGERMTLISVKFTIKELELLSSLASDQLFRREFIDPKMPGYKSNSGEISLGKVLITRLRSLLDPDSAKRTPPAGMAKLQQSSRRGCVGVSDAV